jgi:uncharacterized membrane protein
MNWRIFVAALIVIPALDFIWLGKVAKPFYMKHMDGLITLENGGMQITYWAAAVVYFLLALGITLFVGNYLEDADNWIQAFGFAAVFGLITYGVYDFTNHATLKSWPLVLLFADMAWGSVVCGVAGVAGYLWVRG